MTGMSRLVGLMLVAGAVVSQTDSASAFGVAPEAVDVADARLSGPDTFRPGSKYRFNLAWPVPPASAHDGLGTKREPSLTSVVASLEAGQPANQRKSRRGGKKKNARSVVEVILNEMVGSAMVGTTHAIQDAIFIASVIANRAVAAGLAPQEIVSVQGEFNGYGIPLRRGAEIDQALAHRALEHVARYGPVHEAMYYATPEWADNLPDGLVYVAQTAGHVYFSDPLARSYRTAQGYVRPDRHVNFEFLLTLLNCEAPIPTPRPAASARRSFR